MNFRAAVRLIYVRGAGALTLSGARSCQKERGRIAEGRGVHGGSGVGARAVEAKYVYGCKVKMGGPRLREGFIYRVR